MMASMNTLDQLRAGQLAGATRLDLDGGLQTLPPEVFELADTLEVLNLSGNALHTLPADMGRLHKLKVLFASGNPFTELPAVLGDCPALEMVGFKSCQIRSVPAQALPPGLRWLILTDNQIEQLPNELGHRPHLEKLMLAGNHLRHLPHTLAQCGQLALLRISANRLAALPSWLPTLPSLSWLAFGGNPCTEAAEAQARAHNPLPEINWQQLHVGDRLGEGASGEIHAALWQAAGPDTARPVALKLFKGQMTSDGLPRSEMAASLAAKPHPRLIGVHGPLGGHPQGREGLVMARIDEAWHTLAAPPSLASCSRDVYAPTQHFTLAQALNLAHGLASAAAHLHADGLLHGDLYAHNTLWQHSGACLLGDLGAASFLPAHQPEACEALTRLEVRALGCLLEELLARVDGTHGAADQATLQAAQNWMGRCMQPEVLHRPAMAEVAQGLGALIRP